MTTKTKGRKSYSNEDDWSEFDENVTNIADEKYDFDLKFSPGRDPSGDMAAVNSHSDLKGVIDDEDDDDDDVFFGPVGHKERCLKAALEQEIIKPDSPLRGRKVVELFKEATSLAIQLEHNQNGNKYTPRSRATNNVRRSLPVSKNLPLSQGNNTSKRKSDQISAHITTDDKPPSKIIKIKKTDTSISGDSVNSSTFNSHQISKLPKCAATDKVRRTSFNSPAPTRPSFVCDVESKLSPTKLQFIINEDKQNKITEGIVTISETASESKSTSNSSESITEKVDKGRTDKNNQKSIPTISAKSQISKLPRMASKGTNFKLKCGKIPTSSRIGRAPLKAFNGAVKTQIASVNKSNKVTAVEINIDDNCGTNAEADNNPETSVDKEITAKASENCIADISVRNSESGCNSSSEASCANLIDFSDDVQMPQKRFDKVTTDENKIVQKENAAVDLLISI